MYPTDKAYYLNLLALITLSVNQFTENILPKCEQNSKKQADKIDVHRIKKV